MLSKKYTLLLIIPLLLGFSLKAMGEYQSSDFKLFREGDKHIIKIKGQIAYPMKWRFEEAFKDIPTHSKVLIHLNSNGGSVSEGVEIIKFLKQKREDGWPISTSVHNGENCGSMCVPIFLQGVKRYAGEVSSFFFHGATRHLSNIPNERTTNRLLNLFRDRGVSEKWIKQLKEKGVFSTPGEYWLSGKELYQSEAQIITHPLPRHTTYEPQEAPYDPQIRPR